MLNINCIPGISKLPEIAHLFITSKMDWVGGMIKILSIRLLEFECYHVAIESKIEINNT